MVIITENGIVHFTSAMENIFLQFNGGSQAETQEKSNCGGTIFSFY